MAATLSDLAPGTLAVIRRIPSGGGVFLRLREMGVLPGTNVKLLRVAPLGDPLEIQVRGYNLSVRRAEAAAIEVECPPPTG
ncbi:MAG TPA: FeoA family protein [Opitutaceae bacterium]|nr:FeoA family protein [Opitutaceae bacterium]